MSKYDKVDYAKYEKYLAGRIADTLLRQTTHKMFPEAYADSANKNPFNVVMHGRLEYGRGGPKMETSMEALKEKGVLDSYVRSDANYSSRYGYYRQSKPDIRWHIEVNKEWYRKWAKAHQTEPVFELRKTVEKSKKYGIGTESVAASEKDGYRCISKYDGFNPGEAVYILDHMKEYDFRLAQSTHSSKYRGTTTTYSVLCYPFRQHQDLARTVFEGHLEHYVKTHFEVVVEHLFKLDPSMVSTKEPGTFLNYRDDMKKWTPEKTSSMIASLTAWQNYANKYLPLLQEILNSFNDRTPEQLVEQTIPLFREYLEQNYPCHLEDNDKELQQLAQWMVQGKHQGKLTEMV